jgi:hypothetical protein
VEAVWRIESARIVGTLARLTGDDIDDIDDIDDPVEAR